LIRRSIDPSRQHLRRTTKRPINQSIATAANADVGIGADRVFDRSIRRSVDLLMPTDGAIDRSADRLRPRVCADVSIGSDQLIDRSLQ